MIKWPNGKKFAFTIIDDTDNAFIENIKPVYDILIKHNLRITKTVWVYPPRDKFTGDNLQNEKYLKYILELKKNNFQIELHNVGSGNFLRNEIFEGIKIFEEKLGHKPTFQINHSRNPDNIYWGYKRFVFPFSFFFKLLPSRRIFKGDDETSEYFWGDFVKQNIKFCRNLVFNGINTLNYDPKMPYIDYTKEKHSNYWFSSSDAHTLEEFCSLLQKNNIDKLEQEGGCCIAYTHFASGFVNEKGEVNKDFETKLAYLSSKNGWFVPANELLEFLLAQQVNKKPSYFYFLRLNLRWFYNRIVKKIKFNR